jgi:FKBP-type peptidyl-prolyl cis-trans isomerase SlyD
MKVEPNKVVSFHYRVRDEAGTMLEESYGGAPLAILYGHGNLIPGLERAIAGRVVGERFDVVVPPEQGYGVRRADYTQRVPKKYLPDPSRVRPGMRLTLSTRDGPRSVTVLKVGASVVDLDLNHPLAGQTLHFAVEITAVREAAPDELEHGHVHGAGGHPH